MWWRKPGWHPHARCPMCLLPGHHCRGSRQKPARRAEFDLRLNRKLSWPIKLIWPVHPCLKKYFASHFTQITFISATVPSHRGAARDRHGRGAGCGGRGWRLRRGRQMRTAKPCGPDAPMLASSSWEASFSGATVAKKPVAGESTE
jgi:hypothetical protein